MKKASLPWIVWLVIGMIAGIVFLKVLMEIGDLSVCSNTNDRAMYTCGEKRHD